MMSIFSKWTFFASLVLFLSGCQPKADELVSSNLDFACEQINQLGIESLKSGKIPRALTQKGTMHWAVKEFDWTEGFFPGVCWYLYEYSSNQELKNYAVEIQNSFVDHRFYTNNHDLGFVFNCSFGNAYRLTGDTLMRQVLVDAGNSLITRFNPKVGCIQSWDVAKGWQAKREWQFPVIIDNMMNLELLFKLSEFTGDSKYKEIAIRHANTTLENHFRNDGSSYHVVDYDSITGLVRSKQTAQGYSHESVWARGQAWALYGYTMCYRFTNDQKYLDKAMQIADYLIAQVNLPNDHIPYWDFSAPKIPNEPRDASAAAIIASALIELSGYCSDGSEYLKESKYILTNLSSNKYRAELGRNGHFILKHSVGSIPHGSEIDVPIIYADYYYVEALMRLRKADCN